MVTPREVAEVWPRALGRPGRRALLVDLDELIGIDDHDVAAELGAGERPGQREQHAVRALARVQELDQLVFVPGMTGDPVVWLLAP